MLQQVTIGYVFHSSTLQVKVFIVIIHSLLLHCTLDVWKHRLSLGFPHQGTRMIDPFLIPYMTVTSVRSK